MAHRIVVVGVSGNGKTTLGRRLVEKLGVPGTGLVRNAQDDLAQLLAGFETLVRVRCLG